MTADKIDLTADKIDWTTDKIDWTADKIDLTADKIDLTVDLAQNLVFTFDFYCNAIHNTAALKSYIYVKFLYIDCGIHSNIDS